MNDKWMESGFMLIQQVAHLAKYQTLKEMESCGLKPNQAGILVVLRSEGGLSQKELAKRMGVTPPSMTAALKKMEKQGYVLREQDEKDQRITRIRISDQGIECLNGLQHMMRNLEKRLYEGISAEERQEMKETCSGIKSFKEWICVRSWRRPDRRKCRKNRFNRKEKFHLL